MDAFAVSICKGLAMKKLTVKQAVIVGAWFGGFQALMPTLGYLLGTTFARFVNAVSDWIAFVLLALIGANMIKEALSKEEEEEADTVVQVNWQLAKSYQTAMQAMSEKLDLKNDVTVSTICRFPDVLTQTAAPADPDTLWADVEQVAQQAVAAFVSMRAVEGEKLRTDVLNRLAAVETLVAQIEQNSAGRVQAYTERLYTRLKELLEDRNIDDARIVTEAAIFADKTAIDEETVRLHSHVAQYRSILELDEPVGRKLDFLTQELNRESNTIGSKCQDINITRLVVELKSEIEKIREQIQNIE